MENNESKQHVQLPNQLITFEDMQPKDIIVYLAIRLNQDLLIFIENISSNWIKLRKYWNCSDLSKFPVFGEWDPQFYNVKEMEEYYDSDSVTKEQLKIKYWPRAPYKIGVNGYYYYNNEEVVNYIIKHNLQDYYPEILEKYNKKA